MYSSIIEGLFPGFASPPAARTSRRGSGDKAAPDKLPPGFVYQPEFLTAAEEAELLACFAGQEFRNSTYKDYTARRRGACFSLHRDTVDQGGSPRPVAPDCLLTLAIRVAARFGFGPEAFAHALITEYPPGAPMGWHRDAPPCAEIYGVSLASDCVFRLRPLWAADPAVGMALRKANTLDLTAQPRSLYVMSGPARSDWQHAIAPVKELRYSVTLRTHERRLFPGTAPGKGGVNVVPKPV